MNISIALATHNGLTHLEKQLESLLHQTLRPQQIVISDDGSTDGTCALLDEYSRKYSFIRIVHTDHAGINGNFQNALLACSGEYIAFCDQDDIWDKDKLVRLAAGFSDKTLLAYGKSILIDAEDRQIPMVSEKYLGFRHYRAGHLPYFFLFSNCISGHAMMIRKSLIESALPFPDGCMYDHWLALIASVKSAIAYVPEAVTYHRIHSSNAVNNLEENRAQKKQKPKGSKYKKFTDQRAALLLRLEKALSEGDGLKPFESDYLSQLSAQVSLAEKQFFNLQLFLLLYRQRHQLFHGHVLRECRNRALGGRYFKLLDTVLKRPNS